MQITILLWLTMTLPAFLSADRSGSSSPAQIAGQFCQLEIQGAALDSTRAQKLWALTVGEEEPFMGGDEIASGCRIARSTQVSRSSAVVRVQYHVRGRIVENPDGSKKLVKADSTEVATFKLSLVHGEWRIEQKSLMHIPARASAKAWADHLQTLIEPDDAKKTALDKKLQMFVAQLRELDHSESSTPSRSRM